MKHGKPIILTVLCLLMATWAMKAQRALTQDPSQTAQVPIEEEDGPILTKFEPDFLQSNEERMAEIRHKRSILDTLDISERKRRRLLKDLYKNLDSERLSKALWVDTEFEDIEH